MTEPTPYETLGGEAGVRKLVDHFYDYMDSENEAEHLRSMHAKSLRVSREKLFLFLSGWLGGPDLYIEKYGHPRLRRRHLPFAIGKRERDQWMYCMQKALGDMPIDDALREQLARAFQATADHMRNQAEHLQGEQLQIVPTGGAANDRP